MPINLLHSPTNRSIPPLKIVKILNAAKRWDQEAQKKARGFSDCDFDGAISQLKLEMSDFNEPFGDKVFSMTHLWVTERYVIARQTPEEIGKLPTEHTELKTLLQSVTLF